LEPMEESTLLPSVATAVLALLLVLLSVLLTSHRHASSPKTMHARGREQSQLDGDSTEHERAETALAAGEFLAGVRVQFHGLQKAPEINSTYGVVLRYDAISGRYAVRKEIAHADESPTITVRSSNLREITERRGMSELQELLDAVPAGSRVALPRGEVSAASSGCDGTSAASDATLVINSAITLVGMGSRSGGTVLGFNVEVGPDVVGASLELSALHIKGTLDISPWNLARLRLSKVSVTAPATASAAVYLDEIAMRVPDGPEAEGRVVFEGCWIRGGKVGVLINAVGCILRRCRVQGAGTFGVRANADFTIEACTIGECAKSGAGGGILTRGACKQVRASNGINENRVQTDAGDKHYSGYNPDCRGCLGRCTCTAFAEIGMMLQGEGGLINWASQGEGKWQTIQ